MFAVGVPSRADLSNNTSSFMSMRQLNRISSRPSLEKQREAKLSMLSRNEKIVIEVNGTGQKKRAYSRVNISKGSNFNSMNKSSDAKSL